MKKILLVLFLLCLSNPAWATNWCEDANISVCLLFADGSGTVATDSSANSIDFNFKGADEPAWNVAKPKAYAGGSVLFDGSDDYMVAESTSPRMAPYKDFFNVYWIFPETLGEGNIGSLMHDITSGSGNGLAVRLEAENLVRIYGSGGTFDRKSVNNSISLNEWNHIGIIREGSQTAANTHIYVNGVEVSYATTTDGTVGDPGTLAITIGARGGTYDRSFDGYWSETALFSSNSYDSTDINDIMDNGLVQEATPATRNRYIFIN